MSWSELEFWKDRIHLGTEGALLCNEFARHKCLENYLVSTIILNYVVMLQTTQERNLLKTNDSQLVSGDHDENECPAGC
jgi:uncharacterized membrane protein YsdA (DUF1294 family)